MANNNDPISIGPIIAVYPRLGQPDTKFDDLGIYKADGKQPLAEAEPLMKRLTQAFKAHTGKAPNKSKNPMWEMETDEEGDETGMVIWKLRVKNKLRKRDGQLWDRKPKIFDAALKPVDVNPFGGSKYVVSAEIYEWDAGGKKGISLQPLGVQVLELVSGSGPSASSMGFKAQEGFTADVEYDTPDEDEDNTGDRDGRDDDDDAGDDDGDY